LKIYEINIPQDWLQVAPLSPRDFTAGCISYGQKCKTGTARQ